MKHYMEVRVVYVSLFGIKFIQPINDIVETNQKWLLSHAILTQMTCY